MNVWRHYRNSLSSLSRAFLWNSVQKNPQTRNGVFRKTTDFDCDSLHSEIAWFCLLWWSRYQIWVRCIASPYETNFPLVEFNEVQLRRDNSKIICVTLLVVSFLLLDFDPVELWPAYFVKDLIDVVILLWLLFGPIASYTFMVTIKEMWSKNIRKPWLSRRPSVFFFHLINLTSLRCVGFPTTAMHFVKLRVMHLVITEPLIDSPLAQVLTDLATVAPFTDCTTACIQILEWIVHTCTCLGLKLLCINILNK